MGTPHGHWYLINVGAFPLHFTQELTVMLRLDLVAALRFYTLQSKQDKHPTSEEYIKEQHSDQF